MRYTRVLLVFLATLGGVQPLGAQVKLEWKLQEGDAFVLERTYHQKQTVEVKGKQTKQEKSNTWTTRIKVKEKNAAGAVLDFKIEAVSYKTAGAAVPDPFDDKMAAKMKGMGFLVTLSPQGKVAKLEGYDDFIKKLAEKNEPVEKVLRALLAEDSLRDGIEEVFGFLPSKAVRPGDKWKREAVDPVPPFGSFKVATEYVLEGQKDDEHTIAFTSKMTYRPPSADPELFRVVKGSLTAEESKGMFVFDAVTGRLVHGEKNARIKGEVVLEAMGQQTPLEFTSENTLKVRVLEEQKK